MFAQNLINLKKIKTMEKFNYPFIRVPSCFVGRMDSECFLVYCAVTKEMWKYGETTPTSIKELCKHTKLNRDTVESCVEALEYNGIFNIAKNGDVLMISINQERIEEFAKNTTYIDKSKAIKNNTLLAKQLYLMSQREKAIAM